MNSKLSTLNTLILVTALMAESPVGRRPYIKDSPEAPPLEEIYPTGREAMLEMGVFAHPVVIKGMTNGMAKVRADLLGKVSPGQKAFLNPGHFVVHRVSRSTVMLRPVIA